jgi:hypothetical protein
MENSQNIELMHECIKTTSNFTHSIVYNICDGTQHIIPAGTFDYMICIPILLVLFLGTIFLSVIMLKSMFD